MSERILARKNEKGDVQTLENHLVSVAKQASQKAGGLGLSNLLFLAGLLHDIGKACIKFQDYLDAAVNESQEVRRGDVDHATAGGKYIFEKFYADDKFQRLTAQMMANALVSHHGLNDCLSVEGNDVFHKRLCKDEEISFDEVLKNTEEIIFKKYNIDELFQMAVNEIKAIYPKVESMVVDGKPQNGHVFVLGCLQRMALSILIDADRRDAAEFENGYDFAKEEEGVYEQTWARFQDNLNVYVEGFNKNDKLYKIRNKIFEACFKFAKNPAGIYCLAVPTGGGKTLGSINFALEHCKEGRKKRIIYISPFLSILEQNADDYRKALKASEHILEHHSNVILDNEDEEDTIRYKYALDTWEEPIVLTTMVQFLEVLFKDKTRSIRRMNSLIDSVIIIDEIQSLPVKCIGLFNGMMNFLSKVCNATIVLCSATQPLLGQVDKPILYGEPQNIIDIDPGIQRAFKRVQIIPATIKGGYNRDDLVGFIMDKNLENESILIILNTKKAVRDLYADIERLVQDMGEDIEVHQLTTYMCAAHRKNVVGEIKDTLKNRSKKLICISTQLIEAGVHISFQCVIRSLAGLDNIAQAAGRCNRNGEWAEGSVYIINYNEENISKLPDIKLAQGALLPILDKYESNPDFYENDLLSQRAMDDYYAKYFFERKREMDYIVPKRNLALYDLLTTNEEGTKAYKERHGKLPALVLKQAFKSAGQYFEVIGSDTIGLLVPYEDGKKSIEIILNSYDEGTIYRELKKMQRYTVNLFRTDKVIKELEGRHAIDRSILEGNVLILREVFYDKKLGINIGLEDQIF